MLFDGFGESSEGGKPTAISPPEPPAELLGILLGEDLLESLPQPNGSSQSRIGGAKGTPQTLLLLASRPFVASESPEASFRQQPLTPELLAHLVDRPSRLHQLNSMLRTVDPRNPSDPLGPVPPEVHLPRQLPHRVLHGGRSSTFRRGEPMTLLKTLARSSEHEPARRAHSGSPSLPNPVAALQQKGCLRPSCMHPPGRPAWQSAVKQDRRSRSALDGLRPPLSTGIRRRRMVRTPLLAIP